MLLAIDIGNTNIVMGCMDEEKIIYRARFETDTLKTEDEYAIFIKTMLDMYKVPTDKIDSAIISSVVPSLVTSFKSVMKRLLGIDALIVGSGIKTGMNILLGDPAEMGADLVAGSVGAIAYYSLPAVVFDMGTATTIGVIDKNSNYVGGAIFPGLRLSLNALISKTSLLPKINLEAPKKCIGTNTIDCLKSGAIYGTCSMIDGLVDRIEEELGEKVTVIATGGLAGQVIKYCKHDIIFDDDLLLKGLYTIYKKNIKAKKK